MTNNDALSLNPGEKAVRLTRDQMSIILRALSLSQAVIFRQRQEYIENNVKYELNDPVYTMLWEQHCAINDLAHDLESGEMDI
jgi:hypothetical protein